MGKSPHDWHPDFYQHLWLDFKQAVGSDLKLGKPRNGNRLGYHRRRDQLPPDNFSVVRSVDRRGPNYATAINYVFPSVELVSLYTARLLSVYDNPHDGRVGSHNLAELFGTVDGITVAGRVHGRYASGDSEYLSTLHVALNRQWSGNSYVFRSVLSVLIGEPHADWLVREHPRAMR